jgi:uncharacterized protein (DUF736 family)
MATIGAFTKSADGSYNGSIKTLTLNVKAAQLRAAEKTNDKAPDYRIFAGGTEFGAAWKKVSSEDRDYLSVKLSVEIAVRRGNPIPLLRTKQTSCEGRQQVRSGRSPTAVNKALRMLRGSSCFGACANVH